MKVHNGSQNLSGFSSGCRVVAIILTLSLFFFCPVLSGCSPQVTSPSSSSVTSTPTPSITLNRIRVTPAAETILVAGIQQYTATGTYSDGSTANITAQVTWSTSNSSVASISTAGVATGLSQGHTNVTAQLSSITGSTTLSVDNTVIVIPNPPADDATYFQIMFVDDTTGGHVLHISFIANKMLLNAPPIENITWLTGGGAGFDDWNNPQLLIVDNANGNTATGAVFSNTNDVTLADLPLVGGYRVLKIPFLMPGDATRSLAGSGRLFITFDTPAPLAINTSTQAGGYAFQEPSPSPAGVGANLRWDFMEINNATPSSNSKNVSFVNTSNVDFFSLGLVIKGRLSDTSYDTFGIDYTVTNPVTSLVTALNALPADYAAGYTVDGGGNFLRFLAPGLSFASNANDLDEAITSAYNLYGSSILSFYVLDTLYNATVIDNNLVFSKPESFTLSPKPTTLNAVAATGPFDTGSTTDSTIQDGMKYCAAYLNRGVFSNTLLWNTPSSWYPSGVQYNQYAKLLHQRFINSAVYAFSYDDVPSTLLTAPAIDTCTSMTLVITNQ